MARSLSQSAIFELWEEAQRPEQLGRRALPYWLKKLTAAKDEEVRAAAAHALNNLLDRRANSALIKVLQDIHESSRVRGEAAEALGCLNRSDKAPIVERTLIDCLSDRSAEVRFWCAYSLGQMKSRKAIPKLTELAKKDRATVPKWWSVRKEARDALKEIESR